MTNLTTSDTDLDRLITLEEFAAYQKEQRKIRKKKQKKARSKREPGKLWDGKFIAIDGEGWDGKYTLLAMSGLGYDLYNPKGISTRQALHYLAKHDISSRNAFVGFGLSYDFENILKDIPETDYIKLIDGEKVNFYEYTLSYIPRKILTISYEENWKTGPHIKTVTIQDTISFFQSSFITALDKWNIPIPPEIRAGKENRADFDASDIATIRKYNRMELDLLVELMERLRAADLAACNLISLKPNHTPRGWYGPGARASNFLNQTDWLPEHPPFEGPAYEELQAEMSLYCAEAPYRDIVVEYPFAAAFFGGRIEAAALGQFDELLYDYDINSAYPFAITRIPRWEPGGLIHVTGLDKEHRIGMYRVAWDLPSGINFYPFPFRSQSDNVFFPPCGEGWYMSPEVEAAVELYGDKIMVLSGYVLRGTESCGSGLKQLPHHKLCSTARLTETMAAERLRIKKEGGSAEKVLKLILNSLYGKTIQQVGSHKNLNPFAAAWITSTCRALILRAIGTDTQNNTISIMTDGILTRKKLPLKLGKKLGEFECSQITKAVQFMPGIYTLWENTGNYNGSIGSGCWKPKQLDKYRGLSRKLNISKAGESLYLNGKPLKIKLRAFVSRRLSIRQKNKFGKKKYWFVDIEKVENFRLGSKRVDPSGLDYKLLRGEAYRFYPAKLPKWTDGLLGSKPYVLDLEQLAELDYDLAATEEELVDEAHIGSLLADELALEGNIGKERRTKK